MNLKCSIILSALFISSYFSCSFSQVNESADIVFKNKNSIQFELFGHGFLYSFNYERIVLNKSHFKTSGQVGLSYYPASSGIINIWIPVAVNEIFSLNNRHHIELGMGCIFSKDIDYEWDNFFSGRLGYRYQKPDGKFVLRIGFTPLFDGISSSGIGNKFSHHFIPYGGIAVGYSF